MNPCEALNQDGADYEAPAVFRANLIKGEQS